MVSPLMSCSFYSTPIGTAVNAGQRTSVLILLSTYGDSIDQPQTVVKLAVRRPKSRLPTRKRQ